MLSVIRKFGLKHCDLPTMVWNVSFLLRALTLNIDPRNKTGTPAIFYLLTVISAGCYFYIYLVSMVWFVFWRCVETGDVLAAMLVFSQGIASEIGPVKLFYTMFYAKQALKIASTSLACDALVVPDSRFSLNLHKILRNVKKRAMIFWIVMVGNGVVYLVKPFFLPGRHLTDDIFIYLGLEPMHETPNYEIAMTITIFGVLFTCYCVVNITAFIIVSTGYVEAQMLAWTDELLHLWSDVEKQFSQEFTRNYAVALEVFECNTHLNSIDHKVRQAAMNKFIETRLKDIIRGHARNLDLLRQIEDVFKGAFVLEFLILIVALVAELLGGLQKTYMEVPFSFIPVVVDCLTGQRLTDASLAFERAVFECKWENFDRSNMKLVQVMLHSSQTTMKLSAGGLTVLNFSFLMTVVRSIYSAYTTLRSYTSM